MEKQKCSRCKVFLPLNKFSLKRDDTYKKMCERCLEQRRNYVKKNKCEHKREKYKCIDCDGSGICEHNRIKAQCKECDGSSMCEHKRRKYRCKECGGSGICEHKRQKAQCKTCMTPKEQKKYIIKRMISHSRQADKKHNRYDADNFIDKCFLEGLFEDNEECYYCKVPFTYEERCSTLVTIERLKNSTGHIKSNCVLACLDCNMKHQSKD